HTQGVGQVRSNPDKETLPGEGDFAPITTGRAACSNRSPLAFAGRGPIVGLRSAKERYLRGAKGDKGRFCLAVVVFGEGPREMSEFLGSVSRLCFLCGQEISSRPLPRPLRARTPSPWVAPFSKDQVLRYAPRPRESHRSRSRSRSRECRGECTTRVVLA